MIYVIRLDATFIKYNQYIVLQLKIFKTNLNDTGIQIIIITNSKTSYLVKALYHFLKKDFLSSNTPLIFMNSLFFYPIII